MKRDVTIRLGQKEYILITDSSEEEFLKVTNEIQREYHQLSSQASKAEIDEILIVMVANLILNQLKLEDKLNSCVSKVNEVLSKYPKSGERNKNQE
ncbi:MAG: hypothetical protein DRP33_04120 [Thermotogae bacterium]|nr:MAG: hypothetical protein DRP33_04120 [Thermotogota bacterium]